MPFSCNRLSFIFALLLLLLAAVASSVVAGDWITIKVISNVTRKFDEVLNKGLDEHLQYLDPVRLEGLQLQCRLLPLVRAKLHDVEIDGLADMRREGEAQLLRSEGHVTLRVALTAGRVYYAANSQVMLPMGRSLQRTLYAHADNVNAYLQVDYDTVTEEVTLQAFHLTRLNRLRMQYDGAPFLIEYLENLLLSVVSRFFSGTVRSTVERTFGHRLAHIFSTSSVFKEMMRSLKQ